MGKKSTKAPDYTELAAASREAADVARQVGNRQLDFAERQYAEMKPYLQQIADTQVAAQTQQMEQAQDYYNYQVETFRPLEQGLVADAERFNTDAYRQQQAQQASAAAGRAFSQAEAMNARSMAARGVNPNSGAAMAMRNSTGLQQAAMRANAMTGARQQAEQIGYARRLDATGLGRGLAGASTAAYGGATAAGSAGGNTAMAAGNQYMSGLGQGAATMNAGFNTAIGGYGSIVDSQTSMYNTNVNANAEVMGALVGAGATAYASDRRLKRDIEFVAVDDDTGLNLYEFSYAGDSTRYIGVMADEVEEHMPEAVIEMDDGYFAVNYDMLGIEMIKVED